MTSLWEVISNLRKLAPKMYVPKGDVDGVILGVGDESKQHRVRVSAVDVCVDITLPVIIKANEHKASVLVAHRSPFPQFTSNLTGLPQLLLQHLLKRNITVYIVHHNWAMVDGGMNDVLAHTLGFKVNDVFKVPLHGDVHPLGRGCEVPKETNLKMFIQYISKRLKVPKIDYVGNPDDEVERLVMVSGKGITPEWLHLAWEQGYDTYLTGHLTHELAIQASQLKIKLVALPQTTTEIPGMSRLNQVLRVELPKVTFNFIEPTLPYSTLLTQP
ncbi:MAG: Nif3-like dinuclear metal center hexameric protein [Candidatus Hermodarchaeia archaeon]|jgi:dinuclear metal center YbgI/SA1388 family protein